MFGVRGIVVYNNSFLFGTMFKDYDNPKEHMFQGLGSLLTNFQTLTSVIVVGESSITTFGDCVGILLTTTQSSSTNLWSLSINLEKV